MHIAASKYCSKGAGRANHSRHGTTFLHGRGTNLLPSFWSFPGVCPFSRSRNTAHLLQKGTLNKTGHKSSVFFFLFSFSTSRERVRASWANAHSTHTHQTPTKLVVPPLSSGRSDCQEPQRPLNPATQKRLSLRCQNPHRERDHNERNIPFLSLSASATLSRHFFFCTTLSR